MNGTSPLVRAVVGQSYDSIVIGFLGGLLAFVASYALRALVSYTDYRFSAHQSAHERREQWYREMHGHAWRAFIVAHNQAIRDQDGTLSTRFSDAIGELILTASKAPIDVNDDVQEAALTVLNAYEDAIRNDDDEFIPDMETHLYSLLEKIREAADDLAYEPTEEFGELDQKEF